MGSDNPETNEENQHGSGNPPDHAVGRVDRDRLLLRLLRIRLVRCGGNRLILCHRDARVLVVAVV